MRGKVAKLIRKMARLRVSDPQEAKKIVKAVKKEYVEK